MSTEKDQKALAKYRSAVGDPSVTMEEFKERRDRFQPVESVNLIPKDDQKK